MCQTTTVYAQVSTDKKIMQVGDEIKITFSLINPTKRDYSFSKTQFKVTDYLLYRSVYDLNNKHFEGYSGRKGNGEVFILNDCPLENDIFSLKTLKRRDFSYKYKLKKKMKISNWRLKYQYMLVNAKGDTIILGNAKEFFIRLEYQPKPLEIGMGKKYGFKNMFQGKLISNTVKVRVVR